MRTKLTHQLEAINSSFNRVDSLYAQWAAHMGINVQTLFIFYGLYFNEYTSQKEICESFKMPKQTVNSIVKQLQVKRLVTLVACKDDSRRKNLSLTAQGIEHAIKYLEPLSEMELKALKIMGDELVGQFISASILFGDVIEAEIKKKIQS